MWKDKWRLAAKSPKLVTLFYLFGKKAKLYKIISIFSPITHIYLLYYTIEKKMEYLPRRFGAVDGSEG